jgi:hypothetical protein
MPNWVMNELTCIFETSEEYQSFKNKVDEKNLYNSFIPMPEILVDTQAPSVNADKLILDFNNEGNNATTLQDIIDANHHWFSGVAEQALKNQEAFNSTGYSNWYDWSYANWGVKWDASNLKIKELSDFNTIVFSFDSPWGTPTKFVKELSKMYPDAIFELVAGSIENNDHYEYTCRNGNIELTCSYDDFRSAVDDGKWGGWDEWAEVYGESEEV